MKSTLKSSLYFLSFSVVVSLVAACGSTSRSQRVFTERLYRESGLTSDKIKHVQFYLDRDIVLYRVLKSGDTRLKEGKLIKRGGNRVEQIVLKSGTPGVVVFMPEEDRLGICFDPKNSHNYLMFGPSKDNHNRYSLLAEKWESKTGIVTYGPNKWKTPASSAYASLLVDYKDVSSTKYRTVSPEGRTIED
ncbi:MAG: hypothetical protein J5I59_01155 [Saprospiraceae bacterium]|nr:hypothetical protein [Saprospiraceae bacterium]